MGGRIREAEGTSRATGRAGGSPRPSDLYAFKLNVYNL